MTPDEPPLNNRDCGGGGAELERGRKLVCEVENNLEVI